MYFYLMMNKDFIIIIIIIIKGMFSVIQEKTVLLTCLESSHFKRRTKSGRAICERCAAEGRLCSFFASSTYVTAKERLPAVLSLI